MANSLGLILANRAVVLGAIKARDLLDLTVQAERSRVFDAVWVGDSLLAKPRLESVTLLPALAGLTGKGGGGAAAAAGGRGFRRVARHAAGWMTNKLSPSEFAEQFGRIRTLAREEGRDPSALGSALYHNINITEDRAAGLTEAKAFLDAYYSAKFSPQFVEQWTI